MANSNYDHRFFFIYIITSTLLAKMAGVAEDGVGVVDGVADGFELPGVVLA